MTSPRFIPDFKCKENLKSGNIIFYQAIDQSLLTDVIFENVKLISLSSKPPELRNVDWSNQHFSLYSYDNFGVDTWRMNNLKLENITETGIFINQDDMNVEITNSEFKNVQRSITWHENERNNFLTNLNSNYFSKISLTSPLWSLYSLCSPKIYKLMPKSIGVWFNYAWSSKNEQTVGCKSKLVTEDGHRIKIIAKCINCRSFSSPILKVFDGKTNEHVDSFYKTRV